MASRRHHAVMLDSGHDLRGWRVAILCYSRAPHWFPAQVAMAAQEFLNNAGCLVRVFGKVKGRLRGAAFLRWLRAEGIHGAIDLGHNWLEGRRIRCRLGGFPFVCAERKVNLQSDCVLIDETMVARLALDHLSSLGYRQCGYLVALEAKHVATRLAAFEEEARRLRIWDSSLVLDLRPELAGHLPADLELTRLRRVASFFRRHRKPMAMCTHNDFVGAALVEWLLERGYRVPEDVAVVGVDNDPLYALANVGLTTVDIHPQRIGREAARLLLARLAHRRRTAWRHVLLRPELVVRASTLSTDQGAPWLQAALNVVQERFDQGNLVRDVAARVGWREETLSRRFHRVMGCRLLTYRNRIRLQQASKLLRTEPHAKIAEVARRVGFSTPSRFAALFRQQFGVGPRDYRHYLDGEH